MKFKVGDQVKFINKELHEDSPFWYPPVGTIGVVKRVDDRSFQYRVKWENGSTSGDDFWWVGAQSVESVLPKIKVGDRVKTNNTSAGYNKDEYGLVIDCNETKLLVEFDNIKSIRHSGKGKGKNGHCWWVYPVNLTKLDSVIKKGDVVRFISENEHRTRPQWYPKVGTLGTVIHVNSDLSVKGGYGLRVQWEYGSTSRDDCFWCSSNDVEKIDLNAEKGKNMSKFKVGDRVEVIKPWCAAELGDVGVIKWVLAFGKYAVEFERKSEGFHDCDGHTKDYHGHWMLDEHLKLFEDKEEIVLTRDGKTVTAKLLKNGETVKTAKARCHPDDAFDFGIGAKLAIERLFAPEPKFKVGDRVIGNDLADERYLITKKGWIGTVIKVNSDGKRFSVRSILDECVYSGLDVEAFDLYIEPEYLTCDVVCVEAGKGEAGTELDLIVGKIYHIENGFMKTSRIEVSQITSIDDLNTRFNTVKFIELVK